MNVTAVSFHVSLGVVSDVYNRRTMLFQPDICTEVAKHGVPKMEIEVPDAPAAPVTHDGNTDQPRCNYVHLATTNPLERDGRMKFFPDLHTYELNGLRARTSVTGLVSKYFQGFDPKKVVDDHFEHWKRGKSTKYYALIRYLSEVGGRDEDFCKSAIRRVWELDGAHAADEGTKMHEDFEAIVNNEKPPQGETKEVVMFRQWLALFCKELDVEPFRSEMLVYYLHGDRVLVAGQVDLVLRGRTDKSKFVCVDYKRTDPTPPYKGVDKVLLGQEAPSRFANEQRGMWPFSAWESSKYWKYCAQQNIYGHIAAEQYNIDFRDNMFLLQIHPGLDRAHAVTVPRASEEMEALFRLERERWTWSRPRIWATRFKQTRLSERQSRSCTWSPPCGSRSLHVPARAATRWGAVLTCFSPSVLFLSMTARPNALSPMRFSKSPMSMLSNWMDLLLMVTPVCALGATCCSTLWM